MSLVSSVIQQAYRETNIIPLGATPNALQMTEALDRLNVIVLSTIGNEGGEPGFEEINIGGDFDQSERVYDYVPDNTRLLLNLDADVLVGLSPVPYEGQRVAIVDVLGNLSTYNLVIDGNGRNIEGAETVTLSENSLSRQWMYRADTSNWVRISTLEVEDDMPLPLEYDDYFVIMLAIRLSPRYGLSLSAESLGSLRRTRSQIRSRYQNKKYLPLPDPGLLGPNEMARFYNTEDRFTVGNG